MTLRFRLALTPLLAAAALVVGAPARAQDMPTVLPRGFELQSILNQQRVDAAIASGRSGAARSSETQPRQRSAPAAGRVSTTYVASPAVSARVRGQFATWVGQQAGPEAGRRIDALLRTGDPVRSWAGIVGSDGLRPGDLADALASYWILNWVMANGGDNNRAQAEAVRRQIAEMVGANPTYARLGPAQRQEIAETLMLNFLLQHAAYVDAMKRGDKALTRRLGDAAVVRFRNEMGVDLRRLALTEAGFIRR